MKLSKILKKIPFEIKYVFILFFITRLVLTAIGITAKVVIANSNLSYPLGFDIWCVWDCGWYKNIATGGYSVPPGNGEANYAFFPLYPLLMWIVNKIVGDVQISGIILSNIFLIVAGILLYRLVIMDETKQTAFDAVKYLFLFPTAFVFSGVLSESLFLMLIIACFYYSRKGNWLIASISGLLLSLTRSIGVLIFIPLAFEYAKARKFSLRKFRLDALFLLLIPLGLIGWAVYNYHLTGDFLAFTHVLKAWGHRFSNPITMIVGTFHSDMASFLQGIIPLFMLAILIGYYKKIRFSYWFTGIYLIIVPLFSGIMYSMLRYVAVAFPLYILFAKLSRNKYVNILLTSAFALLQGFMMVFWTLWKYLVV